MIWTFDKESEYDKGAVEVPFTPVLSKKLKKKLEQAHVLGKQPY